LQWLVVNIEAVEAAGAVVEEVEEVKRDLILILLMSLNASHVSSLRKCRSLYS
jgi:hypothetical protein